MSTHFRRPAFWLALAGDLASLAYLTTTVLALVTP